MLHDTTDNAMEDAPHQKFHAGHILHTIGLFILIVAVTVLMPLNTALTRAFGAGDIFEQSNTVRSQFNVSPLSSNTKLNDAAQAKAETMAKGHYFQHIAPDGTTPWKYFEQFGYNYELAGENLAITNENADAVISGWLNSPTHRDNLLNGQYQDVGIGVANFGDYEGHQNTIVIVALYGKPAGSQNPLAATSPAGGTAALKPRYLQISPVYIFVAAGSLIILGILLEAKHVHRIHRQQNSTNQTKYYH